MCQESLGKPTTGDGQVPTDWGPAGSLPHPDAGHPTENPPEAAPKQGQQSKTGKIILSLMKLQDGRGEVILIKALHVKTFEGAGNLRQINDS